MIRATKTLFGAIALAGTALAITTVPAKAQVGAYVGTDGVGVTIGDGYYDGYGSYGSGGYGPAYAAPEDYAYGSYYGDGYDPYYNDPYYDGAGYGADCDYYTPPWGFPPD
jgi:hypothetical protein